TVKPDPTPVSPRPVLNIAIAIVLGGMVGVGLAFLLEYLDNSIRTEEDVEKHLGLAVFGSISHIDDEDIRNVQHNFAHQQQQQQNAHRRGGNLKIGRAHV